MRYTHSTVATENHAIHNRLNHRERDKADERASRQYKLGKLDVQLIAHYRDSKAENPTELVVESIYMP